MARRGAGESYCAAYSGRLPPVRHVPDRASNCFIEQPSTFRVELRIEARKFVVIARRAHRTMRCRISGVRHRIDVDVLTAGLEPACAGPIRRTLLRAGWSALICRQGCWRTANIINVYHALMKAELDRYLRDHSDAFDMIVSADTLVYS